jgi:hypothetical protein
VNDEFQFDEALVPVDVRVDDAMIHILFKGGLQIESPVDEFPRLRDATPEKRLRWQLNGRGYGIHWPDVDEDITVRGLIARAKPNLAKVA